MHSELIKMLKKTNYLDYFVYIQIIANEDDKNIVESIHNHAIICIYVLYTVV